MPTSRPITFCLRSRRTVDLDEEVAKSNSFLTAVEQVTRGQNICMIYQLRQGF